MLRLSEAELDWISERLPPVEKSPKGGRPSVELRRVVAGIFWILDNGAKWKDLPAEFGSKSTVHRWFKKWVEAGVLEAILRDAGRCVEERGQYRLYECFIDATFSKARGGGDGIGLTKVGKGVKIMVRWPSTPPRQTAQNLISSSDWMDSSCDLVGIGVPKSRWSTERRSPP